MFKTMVRVFLLLMVLTGVAQAKDVVYSDEYAIVCTERLPMEYLTAIAQQGDREAWAKVFMQYRENDKCASLSGINREFYLMGQEGDIVLVRPKGEGFVLWGNRLDWSRTPWKSKAKTQAKPKIGL